MLEKRKRVYWQLGRFKIARLTFRSVLLENNFSRQVLAAPKLQINLLILVRKRGMGGGPNLHASGLPTSPPRRAAPQMFFLF